MSGATIAVLGGYGAVGAVAVDRLTGAATELRVGGRDLDAAGALCARLGGPAAAHRVDLTDEVSLAAFCAGADVVLNCAGPSYRVLDSVARAARAAGARYVDVAGDEPLLRRVRATDSPDAPAAVVSAGVLPGLTGVLPALLLADDEDPAAVRLELHVGGAARITPVSAVDVLLATGPEFGTSLAAWRDGAITRGALSPRWHTRVPGFSGVVHALPYLTTEVADVAAARGIGEVRQFSVYVSERVPTVLATAWAEDPEDPTGWAGVLAEAADADVAERGRHYALTLRRFDGDEPTAEVSVHTRDPYELSGVVAALTVRALLDQESLHGAHPARDVLDPIATWHALTADPLCDTGGAPLVAGRGAHDPAADALR
ncbi:saccharopine dehydrogenase NADP-binding domain-containing protein [Umezawaea beigongshangensis]|uniref:saccharopine dehydrogenase NADP-binding domain-containing protein n=1 Tax=Umezawaea beigongshangensis TaxID=2780383 RepID=UPI0018F1BB36|nr:saccharopine dehydrogenase NADP-binding domain-containing protein [Umezawaea beigongshangensis]